MELHEFFLIWDKLTPAQQEILSSHAVPRTVRKGEAVHSGGVECTGLLLVQTGQLRAYILSEDGREITLYRLFDRDLCLLSASCMMRSIQFDITVCAEKDTQLLVIRPETYKGVMEQSAALSNFTNEIMGNRFSEVVWLMEQVLWKRLDGRLADFLLQEAAIEGTLTLRLTHEVIGNHMGNPREVVTRMLRYFQSEGLVRLNRGTVELTDPKGLEKLRQG